jgi:LmbE family N-acetylglucosaminyl deacetylase
MGGVEEHKAGRCCPMQSLTFATAGSPLKRILCLGAHSDDIEIGCGGSILWLLSQVRSAEVLWIVFSGSERRAREARYSAERFLEAAAMREVRVENFRDGFFPYDGERLKEYFESLKGLFYPDLILAPSREDFHQDHRLVAELTWNTFRSHLILEYEIIKYDGDLGRPNLYIPLSKEICSAKVRILQEAFQSQVGRSWFTEDAFRAIMRIRGIECDAEEQYAEAFYGRKLSLSASGPV